MKQLPLPLDLPPTEEELAGLTTCGWKGCKKTLNRSDAIMACAAIGRSTIQESFCGSRCRDKWRDELPVQYNEY